MKRFERQMVGEVTPELGNGHGVESGLLYSFVMERCRQIDRETGIITVEL